jgi:hypothetical protein
LQNEFSIKEIAEITGKSTASIYRYIKNEKLLSHIVNKDGQPVLQVRKQDLEDFLGIKIEEMRKDEKPYKKQNEKARETRLSDEKPVFQLTQESLQEAITNSFSHFTTALTKPLEEQALYLVGELRNEVKHLQAEKDTLRQENELLREQVKVLPDFQRENDIYKAQVENWTKEKEDLLSRAEHIRREKAKQDIRHLAESVEPQTLQDRNPDQNSTVRLLNYLIKYTFSYCTLTMNIALGDELTFPENNG